MSPLGDTRDEAKMAGGPDSSDTRIDDDVLGIVEDVDNNLRPRAAAPARRYREVHTGNVAKCVRRTTTL